MEDKKHIYINPITGRDIHENNKTYRQLKNRHFKLKKSPCLYNEKAAKKCLEKIMKHYPKLPILSKTLLNDITVIRNKNGLVHGVVNFNGQMYKLEYPIRVDAKVPELVTVSEEHNVILNNKLNSSDIISSEYILNKLNKVVSGENVMYNPLHDNYTQVVTKPILNEINKQVIPETLPTTNGIAAVIRNQDNLDEITGYINEKNEALKLNTTLNVKVSELQKELSSKDIEINNLKNEIQQKINFGGSDLNKLNTLLITKENEKQQLEKQCTQKINTLYSQLGQLNVKIPQLEDSTNYYYSLIKNTLEKWNPIEDDPERYKSYATWLKDLFVGNKVLKKTDNIEENLNTLVERANMYANSKRTNVELQKINNEYKNSLGILNEQLLEYPNQKIQIESLIISLEKATRQYQNSKITRDLLIESYEKSIKGYLDAIESLKENNVNIGVEMGLLKNKYNDIKELQQQLKNDNPESDTEYNFVTKYFNVTQDYSTLSNLIEKHELAFNELQTKNIKLEETVKDLQKKLKDTSNVNIVNNLDRYKKAFKEIQTKYNNLIKENNDNLKKIIDLNTFNTNSDTLSNTQSKLTNTLSELTRCKEEKIQKEKELSDHLSMAHSISLPQYVTDTLKSENVSVQESIKKDFVQQDCTGYLTNEVGVKFILKWNDQVQKCIQEEVKCNNGEMYSESKGKCLPCEEYDLIWDPITKKCIKQSVNLLVDQNNNIIGENDDNNWTEVIRKKQPKKAWY
jgi:hypothetical protein